MDRPRLPVCLLASAALVASLESPARADHDASGQHALLLADVPGGVTGPPGVGRTFRMDGAGDVDGDGYGDAVVADESRLRLLRGAADGVAAFTALDDLGAGYDGRCSSDSFAHRALGDVSGDGGVDFSLGCGGAGTYEGLYLFFPPSGGPSGVSEEYQHHLHSLSDPAFGRVVSPRIDFDGDGHDDLVTAGSRELRVYPGPLEFSRTVVISDRAALILDGVPVTALDGGEDVDGDGLADVVVADPTARSAADCEEAGTVRLVPGGVTWDDEPTSQTRPLVPLASLEVTGSACGDRLGEAVALIGDLDGDGASELAVLSPGDPEADRPARLALYYGGPGLTGELTLDDADAVFTAPAAADAITAVAGRVDLDADGYGDLVIGQGERSDFGAAAGVAWLFRGGPTRLAGDRLLDDAEVVIVPDHPEGRAGLGLASAGDLDGDGHGDLLVGAPSREAAEGEAAPPADGRVYAVQSRAFASSLVAWPLGSDTGGGGDEGSEPNGVVTHVPGPGDDSGGGIVDGPAIARPPEAAPTDVLATTPRPPTAACDAAPASPSGAALALAALLLAAARARRRAL